MIFKHFILILYIDSDIMEVLIPQIHIYFLTQCHAVDSVV